MPAEATTQAKSLPVEAGQRSRCTDTHVIAAVGDFSVRRVGGIVALHLGCPAGRFVFHVRERSFVRHARAATDDQGNRFRTLQEIEAARSQENGSNDEEPATAGKRETGKPCVSHVSLSSKSSTSSQSFQSSASAAWEFLETHLDWTVDDVADRFGLSRYGLSNWISAHHPRELTALRRAAGRPIRPSA